MSGEKLSIKRSSTDLDLLLIAMNLHTISKTKFKNITLFFKLTKQ